MTIKKYIDDLRADGQPVQDWLECTKVWSNYSCQGYAIDAMKRAGVEPDQIRAVIKAMERSFEEMTVEGAAGICLEWM